jgi:hypothetical protein
MSKSETDLQRKRTSLLLLIYRSSKAKRLPDGREENPHRFRSQAASLATASVDSVRQVRAAE